MLTELIEKKHRARKIMIFTQFADTAHYLVQQLSDRGVQQIAAATGDSEDPTKLAKAVQPGEQPQ